MGWIRQLVDLVSSLFKWFFTVQPWDTGIRVRCGKHIKVFGAGIHFRVPLIDQVYVQNRRRRIAPLEPQNLTTADGKAVTLCGSIGYQIGDVLKLYETLHHAETTIQLHAMSLVTNYIIDHNFDDVTPRKLVNYVQRNLKLEEYGLVNAEFFLIHFVSVKTYRMITEGINNYGGGGLNTAPAGSLPPDMMA